MYLNKFIILESDVRYVLIKIVSNITNTNIYFILFLENFKKILRVYIGKIIKKKYFL